MFLKKIDGMRAVMLKDGTVMTQADLPPDTTRRWVASRKAAVAKGVIAGLISKPDAMFRWQLSEDELEEWLAAIQAFGEKALRATAVQKYRQP